MKIYISHSTGYDFKKELYDPIRNSKLNEKHTFVFPHENSSEQFNSIDYIKDKCDLLIAEVSYKSFGIGAEIDRADVHKVPIGYIYKKNSKLPDSLNIFSNIFESYSNNEELISKIEKIIIKTNLKI